MSDTSPADDEEHAVVLDFLAHGRSDGGHGYGDGPLAYAVSTDRFTLYELNLSPDADISILDRVRIRPDFEDGIERGREVDYEDLSDGARSELDYVIEDVVDENEQRFVDFYNDGHRRQTPGQRPRPAQARPLRELRGHRGPRGRPPQSPGGRRRAHPRRDPRGRPEVPQLRGVVVGRRRWVGPQRPGTGAPSGTEGSL
jgi:hypothetical protein